MNDEEIMDAAAPLIKEMLELSLKSTEPFPMHMSMLATITEIIAETYAADPKIIIGMLIKYLKRKEEVENGQVENNS